MEEETSCLNCKHLENLSSDGLARLKFVYEVKKDRLENPAMILSISITLPNGMRAKFARCGGWERNPATKEEKVLEAVQELNEHGIAMKPFQA